MLGHSFPTRRSSDLEFPHRLGARADERDADVVAELGERRVLGDEAPADPGGVRPGLDEGAFKHGVVEVGPRGGGAERVGQVGLPDERGGAVRVGVEGDRLDRRARLRGNSDTGSAIARDPVNGRSE